MSAYDLYSRNTVIQYSQFNGGAPAVILELVIISEGVMHVKYRNTSRPRKFRTEVYDFSEIVGDFHGDPSSNNYTVFRNPLQEVSYLSLVSNVFWNNAAPLPGGTIKFSLTTHQEGQLYNIDIHEATHRYDYPHFAIFPDGKEQKLSELETPDAIIRPTADMYARLNEDQAQKKREYIAHKTLAEQSHATAIVDYGDDPNVVEACHLWLAYLYNRAFHIWDDANINNDVFWAEFLEIQTLDDFLLDYDYSDVTSHATQVMKRQMYETYSIYDYADGVFTITRSSSVTPDPADSVMAYGSEANHRWLRQRLGLEPRKSLRDATLEALVIALEGTTQALTYAPAFDPNVFAYILLVDELQTYEIAGIANHPLATVETTTDDVNGQTAYCVKVTSEDGDATNKYTIHVSVDDSDG